MSVSFERLLVVAHGGDCTVKERLAFEEWMGEEAVFMAERDNSPPLHDAHVIDQLWATGEIPF